MSTKNMASTPTRLRVQRLDRRRGLTMELGTLNFGPRGELAVDRARPRFETYLNELAAAVNAEETLSIKVPPPEGGRPDAVYRLTASRAAPDLLDVMRRYLEQRYELVVAVDVQDGRTQ